MNNLKRICVAILIATLSAATASAQYNVPILKEMDELDDILVLPTFSVHPILEKNNLPELGRPYDFEIFSYVDNERYGGAHLTVSTTGDCSVNTGKVTLDASGTATVKVTMNSYGKYQLNIKYEVDDPILGTHFACFDYDFSLDEDQVWKYNMKVEDRLGQPFYDYTMQGELPFTTFTCGHHTYSLYIQGDSEEMAKFKEETNDDEQQVQVMGIRSADITLTSAQGIQHHDLTAGVADPTEKEPEAFIIFDPDKIKKSEARAIGESRQIMRDIMALAFNTKKEFEASSTLAAPMLMRLPLKEGTQTFEDRLLIHERGINVFGFNEAQLMKLSRMDPSNIDAATAMELMKDSKGCTVVPSLIRLVEFIQVGSILSSVENQEDLGGVIRGTVTMHRVR